MDEVLGGEAMMSCRDMVTPDVYSIHILKADFSVQDPFIISFTFPGVYYIQRQNY